MNQDPPQNNFIVYAVNIVTEYSFPVNDLAVHKVPNEHMECKRCNKSFQNSRTEVLQLQSVENIRYY